jgi:hypothetical protein
MVPEEKIQEFVTRIRVAAGSNLESVVLYGSAANGHYHAEFSDLNFLCILRDTSYEALSSLTSFARWWTGQKQPPPLLMRAGELEATRDVFSIELTDMCAHHRALYGEDPLATVEVPLRFHRVQVEYELREKLLLLRQRSLLAGEKAGRLWDLMVSSVPSFSTLLRHALIALGKSAPVDRREAIDELSRIVRFDPAAIHKVLDVREHKVNPKAIDVRQLFAGYLSAIEEVAAAVDKVLD